MGSEGQEEAFLGSGNSMREGHGMRESLGVQRTKRNLV